MKWVSFFSSRDCILCENNVNSSDLIYLWLASQIRLNLNSASKTSSVTNSGQNVFHNYVPTLQQKQQHSRQERNRLRNRLFFLICKCVEPTVVMPESYSCSSTGIKNGSPLGVAKHPGGAISTTDTKLAYRRPCAQWRLWFPGFTCGFLWPSPCLGRSCNSITCIVLCFLAAK